MWYGSFCLHLNDDKITKKAYLRVRPFNAEEYKSIEKDEEINNALTLDKVNLKRSTIIIKTKFKKG